MGCFGFLCSCGYEYEQYEAGSGLWIYAFGRKAYYTGYGYCEIGKNAGKKEYTGSQYYMTQFSDFFQDWEMGPTPDYLNSCDITCSRCHVAVKKPSSTKKVVRFKRTRKEIQSGLTKEQCQKKRKYDHETIAKWKDQHPGKHFRRKKTEMNLSTAEAIRFRMK